MICQKSTCNNSDCDCMPVHTYQRKPQMIAPWICALLVALSIGAYAGYKKGIQANDGMDIVKYVCVTNGLVIIEGKAYRVYCEELK